MYLSCSTTFKSVNMNSFREWFLNPLALYLNIIMTFSNVIEKKTIKSSIGSPFVNFKKVGKNRNLHMEERKLHILLILLKLF